MRRFGLLPLLPVLSFFAAGCGLLLGREVVRDEDRLVSRRPGLAEVAGSDYVATGRGRFDPKEIRVAARVTVTRVDHCVPYTESVFDRASVRRRELSGAGLAVDGAALAAGAGAALLMPSAEGKIGMLVLGAVPLGVDGVASVASVRHAPPATVTTRTPEGPAYACNVTGDNAAPLRLGDLTIAGAPGGYAFDLTEDEFMGDAVTGGVPLALVREGRTLEAFIPLDQAYADFVTARATVRRFPTPLRLAKFTIAYPKSAAASKARRLFLDNLPLARDAEELQAVAGLAGLDPELRRAAQQRFSELKLETLARALPGAARAVLRAERDANTFILNGLAEEGKARLAERDRALAALCRDWAEYRLRAGDEAAEAAEAKLDGELGGDAAAARRLLAGCPLR